MVLRLYNTLTRNSEELKPQGNQVKLYCCGPTTYDLPHAGHARAALVPDILSRRLRDLGFDVLYVRNVTDVDDKILARASQNGEDPLEFSKRMTVAYQEQMALVGHDTPTHEPCVSENISQICALIEQLIANGAAYAVDMPGGKRDVYFAVRKFDGYGKLSRRRIDDLMVGARVAEDENKRDPLDFALWKGAAADDWGWDSPWGRGRPGWHIECSAMAARYLGHGFDVHAGGMDLVFPHHENEIAQSEAACPSCGPFAKIWVHNGFVNVDKEKMSKSLGNFVTVSDVLARNDAEAFRWFLLGAHYRGPIQFDSEKLADGRVVFPGVDEAERRVDQVYAALTRLTALTSSAADPPKKPVPELLQFARQVEEAVRKACEGLDDDLNTPVAIAALGELATVANELGDLSHKRRKDAAFGAAAAVLARQVQAAILRVAGLLGLLRAEVADYQLRTRARRLSLRSLDEASVDARVKARNDARAAKNFEESDRIRAELGALGISLRDGTDSTEWTVEQ